MKSKDSCPVWRGMVGKVLLGNSSAVYSTSSPVLKGVGGSNSARLPGNLFERQFGFSPIFGKRNKEEKVSPSKGVVGFVANPVVLPLRLGRHMVYKSDPSILNALVLSALSGAV